MAFEVSAGVCPTCFTIISGCRCDACGVYMSENDQLAYARSDMNTEKLCGACMADKLFEIVEALKSKGIDVAKAVSDYKSGANHGM